MLVLSDDLICLCGDLTPFQFFLSCFRGRERTREVGFYSLSISCISRRCWHLEVNVSAECTVIVCVSCAYIKLADILTSQ